MASANGHRRKRRSTDSRPVGERRVVAITGAYSFIGAELTRRLEADPRVLKIVALDIRKPVVGASKTEFRKVDLTLPAADAELATLFRRENVDTLVHTAFLSSPTHNSAWEHELESIGTMHLLNAAGEARVPKIVQWSSTLVYGPSPHNPNFLREDHPLNGQPRSRFINEKVEAEKQAQRFAEENSEAVITVLRTARTLGPSICNFATRFFSRPVCPVLMGYDPLFQFVHERDVVEAFFLAVMGDHPGAYNIVGDGVLPYTTVLALMGKLPLHLPRFLAYPLSQALWATQIFEAPPAFLDFLRFLCVADGAKARRELGFCPRYDIKTTILDFLGVRPSHRPSVAEQRV